MGVVWNDNAAEFNETLDLASAKPEVSHSVMEQLQHILQETLNPSMFHPPDDEDGCYDDVDCVRFIEFMKSIPRFQRYANLEGKSAAQRARTRRIATQRASTMSAGSEDS